VQRVQTPGDRLMNTFDNYQLHYIYTFTIVDVIGEWLTLILIPAND
jgi:hypothetical protein